MQTSEISVVVSICALVTSVVSLIVSGRLNKVNQLERRHSEMVQLKREMLSALYEQRQRLSSVVAKHELAGLKLKSYPNSESKIDLLAVNAKLTNQIKDLQATIGRFTKSLENIDFRKLNRSNILLEFQSLTPAIETTRAQLIELESNTTHIFNKIVD